MGFFLFLFLFLFFLILFFITKYVSSKEISSSASASAVNIPQRKYDVFLSFRGEDTRNTFTGHLYEALLRNKIETFIDNQLIRGDEISQSLLDAIGESTISIIVFSERYASSGWCLDELVKILECKNMYGQTVIPVFYEVHPSDVRHQTGTFGDLFLKLEKSFKGRLEKPQKWRAALKEAANLSGFDSSVIRYEPELIKKVVKDILKKLKDMVPSDFNKDLIGVESRIDEIESLLSHEAIGVYTLGIWGMGGIGKTTIAGAFFNKISSQFDASCFLSNIREKFEKNYDLTQLKRELFFTLLRDENLNMGFHSFDFSFEIKRLTHKKVLVVFDDVTDFEQINFLIGNFDWLLPGSLIIVTTRDKHILKICGVKIIYEMKKLENVDALKLFCWHAFRQSHPDGSYEELSNEIMQYAQGVPLVLKVLGCFLYGRSEREWESQIDKLKSFPPNKIQQVLKISYDSLDDTEKKIFLDIACFFNGEYEDLVEKFLDACNLFPKIGISILVERSLLVISNNKVIMHDLLQEMGREIVRQESVDYPKKRSRLCNHDDVYQVLTDNDNMGTQTIQGIYLNMSRVKEISLNLETFKPMQSLRFLKFDGENKIKICNFESEGYIFHNLRYLGWYEYPLKSLSPNIRTENLVFLELPASNLEQLWDGVQNLVNLKRINLSFSEHLTKLPNLSKAQNLEYLGLQRCSSLKFFPEISSCHLKQLNLSGAAIEELPSSIDCLSGLEYIILDYCKSLWSLPSNLFNLKSLRSLDFSFCSNLKSLPEILSCDLERLLLEETGIEELPSSINCLSRLDVLDLRSCKNLKSLPSNLNLKSLQFLNLSSCSNLKSLPEIASYNLESLCLHGTEIENLPSSIDCLPRLNFLDLSCCKNLQILTSSLCKLKYVKSLDLSCSNPQILPEEIGDCLHELRNLRLIDCGITMLPKSLFELSSLEQLFLDGNKFERIPESIVNLSELKCLSLNHCERLQSLPNLPSGLLAMEANHCSALEALSGLSIVSPFWPLYPFLGFRNCFKLDQNELKKIVNDVLQKIRLQATANENSIQVLVSIFSRLDVRGPFKIGELPHVPLQMCYPGSDISEFFTFQDVGSSLTLDIPPDVEFNSESMSFAFCLIVSSFGDESNQDFYAISECVNCDPIARIGYVKSDHVILGHNLVSNYDCGVLLDSFGNNNKAIFKFQIPHSFRKCMDRCWKVKKCGIHLFYPKILENQRKITAEV